MPGSYHEEMESLPEPATLQCHQAAAKLAGQGFAFHTQEGYSGLSRKTGCPEDVLFEKIEAGFAVFKKISTFAALSGETRA